MSPLCTLSFLSALRWDTLKERLVSDVTAVTLRLPRSAQTCWARFDFFSESRVNTPAKVLPVFGVNTHSPPRDPVGWARSQ